MKSVDWELGDTRSIIQYAESKGVLRNQLAYILATAYWESAGTMKPVKEAYWLSEDWRRRNLRYYPWYGRGYVQLTWESNYIFAGKKLGKDFITDPSVVMEPANAIPILVDGMMEGWFTGRRLPQYVTLKASDFYNARRVVNGLDKASAIKGLALQYDRALKKELKYGEDPEKSLIKKLFWRK